MTEEELAAQRAWAEAQLTSLLGPKEDLHPDLVDWVEETGPLGKMLRHPLVYQMMLVPELHAETNRMYEHKKQALVEFEQAGDWNRYIWTYERPYRGDALLKLIDAGKLNLSRPESWDLVSAVWIDSENVQIDDRRWGQVWAHPNTRMTMKRKVRKLFRDLPDPIPVFHGLERKSPKTLGFSWTTRESVAVWFAYRFARLLERPKAYLAVGYIPKKLARTYLLDRGEYEIIAFPKDVVDVKISVLPGNPKEL